jgi:hypothetical protein
MLRQLKLQDMDAAARVVRASTALQLWTFRRNAPARRFCEAGAFTVIQETDGARNEEKEPDALYLGTR